MNAIPKSALIISVLTCINLAGLNMAKAAGDSDLISAETYFHVDHSDVLLKAFNVIVEMGEIEGNVSLNQISDAKFRFFLIDADRAAQDGVSRIGGVSVDKIRGNFLVDQDGDIFIGSRFISFILVNAFNDVLGLAQAHSVLNSSLISGDSEEAAGDLAGLMGSVADIDRISLIRRFAEGSNSDFDLTGLADLSNSLMGMLGMEDLLVFSLAPIVLHEIGHIENGSQGFFLSEVLENYIKSRMLRDEDKADEFAVEKLKTLLENYFQKTKHT